MTTKLKRDKELKEIINIITFPIRLLLFIMCILTECVFKLFEKSKEKFKKDY